MTVISSVAEKSVRCKKVSSIENVLYKEVSLYLSSLPLLFINKFLKFRAITLPEGYRAWNACSWNLIGSLFGTAHRNISHLKLSTLKPEAKSWQFAKPSCQIWEMYDSFRGVFRTLSTSMMELSCKNKLSGR